MNNLSQPPQPTEPDMALLYLGSLFETLDYTLPPARDEAKLDALAWHILDKRPKTLLGLEPLIDRRQFDILLVRPPLVVGNCMRFDHNRREFITLLGGAAAAWPLAAHAQ